MLKFIQLSTMKGNRELILSFEALTDDELKGKIC
jgi:hypothetical protein